MGVCDYHHNNYILVYKIVVCMYVYVNLSKLFLSRHQ